MIKTLKELIEDEDLGITTKDNISEPAVTENFVSGLFKKTISCLYSDLERLGEVSIQEEDVDDRLITSGLAIANFKIKEILNWSWGIWLNIPSSDCYSEDKDEYDFNKLERFDLEVFTQYTEDIDKFKPTRSAYCFNLSILLTDLLLDTCALGPVKFYTGFSELVDCINFIKNHEALAWEHSSNGKNLNNEYISEEDAVKEFNDHNSKCKLEAEFKKEADKRIVDFIAERLKEFRGSVKILDYGIYVSPRYQFQLPYNEELKEKLNLEDGAGTYFLGHILSEEDYKYVIKLKQALEDEAKYVKDIYYDSFDVSEFVDLINEEDYNEGDE